MTFLTYLVAGVAVFFAIGLIQVATLAVFIEVGHRLQVRRIERRRARVIDSRSFRHG